MTKNIFPLFLMIVYFASVTTAFAHDAVLPQSSCEANTDCVIVQDGCCNCFSGGKASSINRLWVDEWMIALQAECEDVMCAMVVSDHWTCQAEPLCVEGRCQLVLPLD